MLRDPEATFELELVVAIIQVYWIFTAIFMSYCIEAMNIVCAFALRGEFVKPGPFQDKFVSGVKLAKKLYSDRKYIPLYHKWHGCKARVYVRNFGDRPWMIATKMGLTKDHCLQLARKVTLKVSQA
jgi:hypothetical protein